MDYPKTHSGDLADLPAALNPLIVRDQWVSWRWIRNGQKWTKPPFRADSPNQHAACNNAATWCPQHAAVAAVQAGQADGVGFVLTGTNIGAIDLDDCRDPDTGEIDSWAKEIVLAAPNAYCEVTVSGTGLRIIGIACGSAQHKRFAVNTGRPDAAIEVYRQATRYITVVASSWASARNCLASTHSSTTSWHVITVMVMSLTRSSTRLSRVTTAMAPQPLKGPPRRKKNRRRGARKRKGA
jgi:putative DNA primase/helicase